MRRSVLYCAFAAMPKNYMSYLMGYAARLPIPKVLRVRLLSAFIRFYKVNHLEAAKPLEEFSSLADFFTRELREGVRPIQSDFVSPVDGLLRDWGRIRSNEIVQIKGVSYTVEQILRDSAAAKLFDEGLYFNFYLSPRDYHRVHAPITGRVVRIKHIPGALWPVNSWSIQNVPGVLARNERMVVYLDSQAGRIAVVMVGAMNVGQIELAFDTWKTNRITLRCEREKSYDPGISMNAGEPLGLFHMGSSVLLLVEKNSPLASRPGTRASNVPVLVGEALL